MEIFFLDLLFRNSSYCLKKKSLKNNYYSLVTLVRSLYFSYTLSSALDSVSHDWLISRLSDVDISGAVLSWFSSYLSDRQFYISVQDFQSLSIWCKVSPRDLSLAHYYSLFTYYPCVKSCTDMALITTYMLMTFTLYVGPFYSPKLTKSLLVNVK